MTSSEFESIIGQDEHMRQIWVEAADEVGVNVDPEAPINIEAVQEARFALVNSIGIAPLEWDGWTNDHGCAARIATDLQVKTKEDTARLGNETHNMLTIAVMATYRRTSGIFPSDEVPMSLDEIIGWKNKYLADLEAKRQP